MNRKTNKFHRDIRDIVELSPEARRILDDMEKIMIKNKHSDEHKVTNHDETNTKNKGDKV